jgi:hypothetical protein
MPSQLRSGHLLVSNLILGAGHGALRDIIKEAEGLKVNRSIYAETRREKIKLFDGIRSSEWNVDINPIVVTVQDVTLKHDFSGGCVSEHLFVEDVDRSLGLSILQYHLRCETIR